MKHRTTVQFMAVSVVSKGHRCYAAYMRAMWILAKAVLGSAACATIALFATYKVHWVALLMIAIGAGVWFYYLNQLLGVGRFIYRVRERVDHSRLGRGANTTRELRRLQKLVDVMTGKRGFDWALQACKRQHSDLMKFTWGEILQHGLPDIEYPPHQFPTVPYFPRTLRANLREATQCTFKPGEKLVSEEDRGSDFLFMVKGRALVEGRQGILGKPGPGMFLGRTALLDGVTGSVTVTALEQVLCLVLPPWVIAEMARTTSSGFMEVVYTEKGSQLLQDAKAEREKM